MVRMPIKSHELADQVKAFGLAIDEAKPRWLYCLRCVKQAFEYKGEPFVGYAERTVKASERILGAGVYASPHRYQQLDKLGYDGAVAASRPILGKVPYGVGPLEPWHLGHVYFARVESHPHVVKIGFSRRVRDRLEDVESRNKTHLLVNGGHLRVGTMLDEQWWHHNWRKFRIEGEWFFDPFKPARELPDFLRKSEAA